MYIFYNIRLLNLNLQKHHSLIIILLIYSIHRIQCQVTKCCPIGSVIDIQNVYSCESPINQTVWDAYNILTSSMPDCAESQNVFEGNETYIELNGCLDRNSNNQFVAVSCSQNPVISVHLLNKCCPNGKSYDHTERFCKIDPDSRDHFKHLFGNATVVFENKVPDCSEDEVFVEYFSTLHDIQFVEEKLAVNDIILPSNKFCVEGLINIDPKEASEGEKHFIIRSCRPRSLCNEITCIRRCCKADQIMKRLTKPKLKFCQPHPNNTNLIPIFHDVSLPLSNDQTPIRLKDYGVLESWKCNRFSKLQPNDPLDLHYLHKDGMLYMDGEEPHDIESYCIENTLNPIGMTETHTFVCFDKQNYKELTKFDYYPYGISISCVFLAITLVVYLSLPKLLNLHGKTLVCYVISFLAGYITLAILQFNRQDRSSFCHTVAFFLLFCFIAAFCWQTVMCFDIWQTFGSLRSSYAMHHNKRQQKKFMYYSAYAWGVPLIWILFTLYAEKSTPLPADWNPTVAISTCSFMSRLNWRNNLLFFILPAGLHVITNCVLFFITAIHCNRVKSEIHQMQYIADELTASSKRKKFIASKAIFTMNLKLFTVMGTSWVLEIISTFTTNQTIQIALDVYNIFYGVFIFVIFVFKRKVFFELKRRFGFKERNIGTPTPRSTTTQTSTKGNIDMADISKSVPLITPSPTTLQ